MKIFFNCHVNFDFYIGTHLPPSRRWAGLHTHAQGSLRCTELLCGELSDSEQGLHKTYAIKWKRKKKNQRHHIQVLAKWLVRKASDMNWQTFQGYSTPATCWHIWHSLLSWYCPTVLWLFACSCSGGPGRDNKKITRCSFVKTVSILHMWWWGLTKKI